MNDTVKRAGGAATVRAVSRYLPYGWVIVGLCFLAQMLTSLSGQGLSTYMLPLQREFGWSSSLTAAGRSFQQADTFLGPINGWLLHRFGARKIMGTGALLFALSFFMFSQTTSLLTFYLACLMMAVANSMTGLLAVSVTLTNWFQRKRATATGIAVCGFAGAGMILIPVVVWLQAVYGWRGAALATAAMTALIALPIILLMRDSPEPYGLAPDGGQAGAAAGGDRPQTTGGALTVGEALRTRAFWLLTLAQTLVLMAIGGLQVHQFPYLELMIDRETATLIVAVLNGFNIAGRIVGGVIGDRFRKKNILMGTNILAAALAMAVLVFAQATPALLFYAAVFGFAWGVRIAVMNTIFADYFGRGAFGRIVGLSQTITSIPVILTPIAVGWAFDVLGDYHTPFLALTVLIVLGALACYAAAPPRPSAAKQAAG